MCKNLQRSFRSLPHCSKLGQSQKVHSIEFPKVHFWPTHWARELASLIKSSKLGQAGSVSRLACSSVPLSLALARAHSRPVSFLWIPLILCFPPSLPPSLPPFTHTHSSAYVSMFVSVMPQQQLLWRSWKRRNHGQYRYKL
jgi:hypothetical protein